MSKSFRKGIKCLCSQKLDSWSAGKVREDAKKRRQRMNRQFDEEGTPILPVQANTKWPVRGGYYHAGYRNPEKFTVHEYRKSRPFLRLKEDERWMSRLRMCL